MKIENLDKAMTIVNDLKNYQRALEKTRGGVVIHIAVSPGADGAGCIIRSLDDQSANEIKSVLMRCSENEKQKLLDMGVDI